MNLLSLIFLVTLAINCINASSKEKYDSTCEIEGFINKRSSKEKYYSLDGEISDTFTGNILATLKTKNIQRITYSSDYLNVVLKNSTLTFSTNERFKDFEKTYGPTTSSEISVKLEMDCVKSSSYRKVYFSQKVKDINNHPPAFNQESYNYSFGMPIPKGLFITEFFPIIVTDNDFTNVRMNFKIDNAENFNLTTKRNSKDMDKNKYTKAHQIYLVANKNLVAPFDQTITITATDEGNPPISISVPIKITIKDAQDFEDIVSDKENNKSPIFTKPTYFADYTLKNEIFMEEVIALEHAASSNTRLKQTGYEEYFSVQFEDLKYKDINIKQISNLPDIILNNFDTISIEIEVSLDIQETSFTTLIIRLPNFGSKILKGNVPTSEPANAYYKCNAGFQSHYIVQGYSIPLVLFALSVCCIIFINTYMIIIFLNKNKNKGLTKNID